MLRQTFQLKSSNKTLILGKQTRIMGIVNITPDSFYDGGSFLSTDAAIEQGLRLIEEGADILDLGGQSTRPTSEPVGAPTEIERVLPVLKAIRKISDVWISVDTYRSEVARICLQQGADLINDVSSFRMDPQMAEVVAQSRAPVVCMHFLQSIHPMPANPEYDDLFGEILSFFHSTLELAARAGIEEEQIIVDPGIGFGKKLEHNLAIIRGLSFLSVLKRPILVGPSRKSFIEKITGLPAEQRLEGTAAAAAVCLMNGAHILRVHDVRFFKRFCQVLDVIDSQQ